MASSDAFRHLYLPGACRRPHIGFSDARAIFPPGAYHVKHRTVEIIHLGRLGVVERLFYEHAQAAPAVPSTRVMDLPPCHQRHTFPSALYPCYRPPRRTARYAPMGVRIAEPGDLSIGLLAIFTVSATYKLSLGVTSLVPSAPELPPISPRILF